MNSKLQLIAELLIQGDDTSADIEIMKLAMEHKTEDSYVRRQVDSIRRQAHERGKSIFCDDPSNQADRAA